MHNTTISLYKAWVNDNKAIPFDEIVELNYNLVINGLSGLIKNTKYILLSVFILVFHIFP